MRTRLAAGRTRHSSLGEFTPDAGRARSRAAGEGPGNQMLQEQRRRESTRARLPAGAVRNTTDREPATGADPVIRAKGAGAAPQAQAAGLAGSTAAGKALHAPLRAFFEQCLDGDLGDARIHTDTAAAEAAALGARAFALGSHIGFATGEYAPETEQGRHLLAHELTHVRQSGGRPELIRRQPRQTPPARERNLLAPPPQPAADIGRAEFEQILRRRFGVRRIATGTEAEQRSLATPAGGGPAGGVTLPGWLSWDPGPSSPAFSSILSALEDAPARFRFIEAHRAQWLPFLTRLPQIGDFPIPRGSSAPA
jgi:hypothetical protein